MINFLPTMLLSVKMICPPTTVHNWTSFWNKEDAQSLERAKTRCHELYFDAPCLEVFAKVAPQTYRATCGRKVPEDR